MDLAKAYAEKAGLQIDWTNPATAVPRRTVITQTPKEFDFPGIPWPPQFHYADGCDPDRLRPAWHLCRIAHHGVGEIVDLDNLSVDNLLEITRKVLTNRSYAERPYYFKEVIGKTRGLDIAADVIEQAFKKVSTEK